MRPVQTLIVIAGERTARLYRNRGIGHGLDAERVIEAADFADGDVEYSDRPGRWTPGPGMAPHAFDHHQSERELERGRFAAHLADALAATDADRIVIAAGPRMLGALRSAMPAPLRARVSGELDKDLLNTPEAELPAHLGPVIAL